MAAEGRHQRIPRELMHLLDMTTKKPASTRRRSTKTGQLLWATRAGTDDDLDAWLVELRGTARSAPTTGQSRSRYS